MKFFPCPSTRKIGELDLPFFISPSCCKEANVEKG